MRPLITLLFGILLLTASSWEARADKTPGSCDVRLGECQVEIQQPATDGGSSQSPQESGGSNSRAASEAEKAALRKYNAEFKAYDTAYRRFVACQATAAGPCGNEPSPPDLLMTGSFNAAGGAPLITPDQAGAIAAARLKIPTVAPGIGPSPDLNRWKMAAVGYPLWLWAEGATQVGPVSDSVAGLSVSLRAEVISLTFRMGDGTTVTCQGVGDKWTKAVEPGAKAPSCGHTYTKPSLPKGNYTVAALTDWAVTWTANGQSGVINVPAVQTAELPVGELQVLVR